MTIRSNMTSVSLALAAIASCSAAASATVLLNEPFTYPNGNLVGQGNWAQIGADNTVPIQVVNNAVSVPDGTGQDAYNTTSTPTPANGSSLFTGVTINVSETNATQGFQFGLVNAPTGTPVYAVRLFSKSSGAGYLLGLSTGNSNTVTFGTTVLSLGTAYNLVIRYDSVSGVNNDLQYLYVNPGTTEPTPASSYLGAAVVSAAEAAFSNVALRQVSTADTGSGQTFDDLKVATTFAEVAPAPEPASLGLIAGAAIVLVNRRHRRS